MNYSPTSYHFACFECRKSFSHETEWKDGRPLVHVCPECGQALCFMGRKFKPPKRRDVKQWQKVELIRKSGGLYGHYYPKYLWQAKNQVQNNPHESEGEKLLRRLTPKKNGKS